MELKEDKQREQLLAWYASQRPLTVDIVGDFAGHELFAVHGESLIRHCLEESKVDFDGTAITPCSVKRHPLLTSR